MTTQTFDVQTINEEDLEAVQGGQCGCCPGPWGPSNPPSWAGPIPAPGGGGFDPMTTTF